ncbi:hypothetical protein GCM10009810_18150 [Nostocoides vanveenii]|uniref:Uncharacterized protein n=1 Tax=Nostocoides vanveenii TaxID=330835 RepID=A0ABP4WNP7_9MICO
MRQGTVEIFRLQQQGHHDQVLRNPVRVLLRQRPQLSPHIAIEFGTGDAFGNGRLGQAPLGRHEAWTEPPCAAVTIGRWPLPAVSAGPVGVIAARTITPLAAVATCRPATPVTTFTASALSSVCRIPSPATALSGLIAPSAAHGPPVAGAPSTARPAGFIAARSTAAVLTPLTAATTTVAIVLVHAQILPSAHLGPCAKRRGNTKAPSTVSGRALS